MSAAEDFGNAGGDPQNNSSQRTSIDLSSLSPDQIAVLQSQLAAQNQPSMQNVLAAMDLKSIITQAVSDANKANKPSNSNAGGASVQFEHKYMQYQFELNSKWIEAVKEVLILGKDDPEHGENLLTDLVKQMEERNALLLLGDKNPDVFKKIDLAKQVEEFSAKTSLPKTYLESILKGLETGGGKASPAKKPKFTQRYPQPFRQGGAAWGGAAAAYAMPVPQFHPYAQPLQTFAPSGFNGFGGGDNLRSTGTQRFARKRVCFICGQDSHISTGCPQRHGGPSKQQ